MVVSVVMCMFPKSCIKWLGSYNNDGVYEFKFDTVKFNKLNVMTPNGSNKIKLSGDGYGYNPDNFLTANVMCFTPNQLSKMVDEGIVSIHKVEDDETLQYVEKELSCSVIVNPEYDIFS